MKEVNQKKFYEIVGPQDACIRIENEYSYPYTTLFELRHSRRLIGKVVDGYTDGIKNRYPMIKKYYLYHE